jgi:hypothetical protein
MYKMNFIPMNYKSWDSESGGNHFHYYDVEITEDWGIVPKGRKYEHVETVPLLKIET